MKILVMNAGSSSLKYQLLEMENESVLRKGHCERIGPRESGPVKTAVIRGPSAGRAFPSHADAFRHVLFELTEGPEKVLDSPDEISAVGHRVTHGGHSLTKPVRITDEVLKTIERLADISPLHNPPQAATIRACRNHFGCEKPMVAVFDTAFHSTMPEKAYAYALPYEYARSRHLRRYGFHGTSHRYVSARLAEILGGMPRRMITCHLGNGSSITAIRDGKSVDTSMGFSPLDGLIMGTRSGSVDPSVLIRLMETDGMDSRRLNILLNQKSGLLGVSGVSNDWRDTRSAAAAGSRRASLAAEMLEYQISKQIGGYAAALGGVDAIVFTGGIGENDVLLRRRVMDSLAFLGVVADGSANSRKGGEIRVSAAGSAVEVWVLPTNEELVIARDTRDLL